MEELYNFLHDSYIILNNEKPFMSSLIKLYAVYISEPNPNISKTNPKTQPINIDYKTRSIFKSKYDDFVEGVSDNEEGMREMLLNLNKNMEKLANSNLIDRDGFREYLLKYSDQQETKKEIIEMEQETEEEKTKNKLTNVSSCCKCRCMC